MNAPFDGIPLKKPAHGEYEADVEVSGGHQGYLRATGVQGDAAGGFTGRIESEVDGNVAELTLG